MGFRCLRAWRIATCFRISPIRAHPSKAAFGPCQLGPQPEPKLNLQRSNTCTNAAGSSEADAGLDISRGGSSGTPTRAQREALRHRQLPGPVFIYQSGAPASGGRSLWVFVHFTAPFGLSRSDKLCCRTYFEFVTVQFCASC